MGYNPGPKQKALIQTLSPVFFYFLSFILVLSVAEKTFAEETGTCPTCPPVPATQAEEYLSDVSGFKAFKAVTSAGKCVVSVFFPAKKAVADLLNGVSLSQDAVEFIDKIQKQKPDWLARADTGVSAVNLAANIGQAMSTQFADKVEAMTNKVGGYLPGFSVVLSCGSTGYDIYKLVASYIDAVDFAVDEIYISPIQKNLPKNDFFYPAIRWTDGAYAEKYQGQETWRVDLRLRQIGGDPSQVGTHWDRIYGLKHWNNGLPVGLFYNSQNNHIITDGSDFGQTPGKATSPKFYTVINESAFAGAQGVRAGTNTYEIAFQYNTAGSLGLFEGEEGAKTYFTVYPDADLPVDPDDPTQIIDQVDDDDGEGADGPPPDDPPFRTPGRDHADENLSVANKDVPDATPSDLRNAFTRLAAKKGLDLVAKRELLKEARQAEKYYLNLLLQDKENSEFQWKWAGATHRIKTHMAELDGRKDEMLSQYLKAPDVAVLDRGYSTRARALLRKLHIPSVLVGTNFSPDMVKDHPVLFIPSAGLYGLNGSALFKARLEEYTRNGGTVVCLTQQYGKDFQILPGGELNGYGWLEDQSCHTRSMAIAMIHPVLSGQDEAILDAGVDGFFTALPENTEVLLKRTKNDMPAAVIYPFGQGKVLALCLYSDWISGLGGETRDDRAILSDIVHWLEARDAGMSEHILGHAATLPVTIRNSSKEKATHVLLHALRPDGTFFAQELKELPLDPEESQTIDYTVPEPATPDQPGLWSVDYVLLDFDGENRVLYFEEPEVQLQTPGAWFQVKKPMEAVTALNEYNFYITSSQESFFSGETGIFTFWVENNTPTEKELMVTFFCPHHLMEYSYYDQATYGSDRIPIARTLTVAAGARVSFDHSLLVVGQDRIFARLVTSGGKVLRSADRQITVAPVTEVISLSTKADTYQTFDAVNIDFSIAPTAGRSLSGEARITLRNPLNQVIYTPDSIALSGDTPMVLSFSGYTVPVSAEPGIYTVSVEILDAFGMRTGGASSRFTVPEKPVSLNLNLPEVIDPQIPATFTVLLNNGSNVALEDAQLDFFVDDPDGNTLFHRSVALETVAIGVVTQTFDVDFSSLHRQGQYVARYEFSAPGVHILRQGQKSFPRGFSYQMQLDRRTYLPTQTATVTVAAQNTGIFHEPLNLNLQSGSAGIALNDTILIPASDVFKKDYSFEVPALGKGNYPLACTLDRYPAMTKNTNLMIRPMDLGVVFASSSGEAGNDFFVNVTSENPLTLDYRRRFVLMDYYENVVFEDTDSVAISPNNTTPVVIVLPSLISAGQYMARFELIDPLNDALVKQWRQAIGITGGVSVEIQSAPGADPYATGNAASVTTEVSASGNATIQNATLEVSVVSTVDTGEFEWEKQNSLLGERYVPFKLPGGAVYSMAFIDLDGDGDEDMTASIGGALYFYENKSVLEKQRWTARPDWKTGYSIASAYWITPGDLNNDGKPDLLIVDNSHNLYALKNTGTGAVPSWEQDVSLHNGLTRTSFVFGYPNVLNSIQLMDMDKDGDLDLYYATGPGNKYAYRNTGSADAPNFVLDTAGLCSGLTAPGGTLIFISLNDDDLMDLMTVNTWSSPNTLDFFINTTPENSSNITWQKQTAETIRYTYNQTTVNKWGFKNYWGLGTIDQGILISPYQIQGKVDINGDQKPDHVLTDTSGNVLVYLDNPQSQDNLGSEVHYYELGGPVEILTPFTHLNYYPSQMAFLDLDGDDEKEIITSSSLGNMDNAAILRNVGARENPEWRNDRTLERALNEDIGAYVSYYDNYIYVRDFAIGDLDGDGLEDLMTYGAKPGMTDGRLWQIWCYKNQGGNLPDFQAVDWLGPVWSALPAHYRPQPYEAPRRNDNAFRFQVVDFDGDGDNDLFISYTWERYVNSYEDYRDTRGTLVAFENTGAPGEPLFTRNSAWETGLGGEVVLTSIRGQWALYQVGILDFDGDGNFEAFVRGKLTEGILGYRYNGAAWVRDDSLIRGISLSILTRPTMPNLVDVNGDGNVEIVATTGEYFSVDVFGIKREEAFEVHETTLQDFTGTLTHETDLGILPVPGRMNLTSRLKSPQGQVLAEFSDHFYVLDSGQSVLLRLRPDQSGYKTGDSVLLRGSIKNMGALAITGTPTLMHKKTGEILGLNQPMTLGPDEVRSFEVTVTNLTESFFAVLAFNEFSVLTEVKVVEPDLKVTMNMPQAVKGAGIFQGTFTLSNPTSIPLSISLAVDGPPEALEIAPNSSVNLEKTFNIGATRTFVVEIDGDVNQTLEQTVVYETGSTVAFDVQTTYPRGKIMIPYNISNPGSLDHAFELVFYGDLSKTVSITAPAGSETGYFLELAAEDLGYGSRSITWRTPSENGILTFSVVKTVDLAISGFSHTGIEGDVTTGFFAGFDCTVKNQGMNDFSGNLRVEIADVSRKQAPVQLKAGETGAYHITLPAPSENGKFSAKAAVLLENEIMAGSYLSFALATGVEVTSLPQGLTGVPDEEITFAFGIKNNGVRPETMDAWLTFPFGFGRENSRHAYLNPGDEKTLTFILMVPDDVPAGQYKATLTMNGKDHEVFFNIIGVSVSVAGSLDKANYRANGTDAATLTLTVENQDPAFNGAALYAVATYGGHQEFAEFTLQNHNSIDFTFDVTAENGRINWGVYQASGRSLVLNDLLVRTVDDDFSLATDKDVYLAGETVHLPFTSDMDGVLTLSIPDLGWTRTLDLTAGEEITLDIPLGLNLSSGTYVMVGTLTTADSTLVRTIFFDVLGRGIKPVQFSLTRDAYSPGDEIGASLTLESNVAFEGTLKATISSESGGVQDLFAGPVSVAKGETTVSFAGMFNTTASGTHFVNVEIHDPSDEAVSYLTCSKAFDVGGIVLLGISTDQNTYSSSEIEIPVTLTAFGSEPGTAQIFVNDQFFSSVFLTPQSVVETRVEIPTGNLEPGRVMIEAVLTSNGLTSRKATMVLFAQDLPDLVPRTLNMVWNGTRTLLSGTVNNAGASTARAVEITFFTQTGSPLGSIAAGDILAGQSSSGETAFDGNLSGETIRMVVSVSEGAERDTTNNTLERIFESTNQAPQITFVGPDSDRAYDETFEATWTAEDPDEDPLVVDIYLDDDVLVENGRIPMRLNLPNTGSSVINMTAVPSGIYYLSISVTDDAGAKATAYSTGRIGIDDGDGDGVRDEVDNCPGVANPDQADADGDTHGNACDDFPEDANEWADADGDGVGDNGDLCPEDSGKNVPGVCGCGVPDEDTDGDHVLDCEDLFPNDPDEWEDFDEDGTGNNADPDDDEDGIPDTWEAAYGFNSLDPEDALQDLDGDGLNNLEEYQQGRDPSNQPPEKPVLSSPENLAGTVDLLSTLSTEAYDDPENDEHGFTVWQISTVSDDFAPEHLVLNVQSDSFLTTLELPALVLLPDQTYFWRVMFLDYKNEPSEWSDTFTFSSVETDEKDQDGDRIPDDQEVTDETVDLDDDGTPDIDQNNMMCVNSTIGSSVIALSGMTRVTGLEAMSAVDPESINDTVNRPENLPYGLISFRIAVANPGDEAMVKLYFSKALPEDVSWYKYDSLNGWQDYSEHADFAGDRLSVTLTLKDGGFGDVDGAANGMIIDPSGPAGIDRDEAPRPRLFDGSTCFIASTAKGIGNVIFLFFLPALVFGICLSGSRIRKKENHEPR